MLEVIILGIVQGLTEFLPISSSAHLVIISWMMEGKPLPLALNVGLHVGTLWAILLYFYKDFVKLAQDNWRILLGRPAAASSRHLLWAIILGSIPAAVLGLLFEHKIEEYFHHPVTVIAPMAIVGIILWQVDKRWPQDRRLTSMDARTGFLIGCAQACALIPGFSRSGSTIIGARLMHFRREDAARFSFLLGTPAIAGAALLHYKDILQYMGDPIFAAGVISSALSGILVIAVFMALLRRFGFGMYALYRLAFAAVVSGLIYYMGQ